MFVWIRELLDIKHEFSERKRNRVILEHKEQQVCETCEVLKVALERANFEKDQLLKELLKESDSPQDFRIAPEPQAIIARQLPWRVRQEKLEQADRIKAEELRAQDQTKSNFQREFNKADTAKLEKEMGLDKG